MQNYTADELIEARDQVTQNAVNAALAKIDVAYPGHAKSSGPLGDALAYRLDTVIKEALQQAGWPVVSKVAA